MVEKSSNGEDVGVNVSSEQLAELLSTIQNLSKKVDTLQNELEVSRSTGTVVDIVDQADRQEAILHTIQRMNTSKNLYEELRKKQTDKVVDLAVDAAILNYKQHPPKHRI